MPIPTTKGAKFLPDFDSRTTYEVYILGEVNLLSNVLANLAVFRRRLGQYWPRKIIIHPDSRMAILHHLGDDIKVNRSDAILRDAMYNWIYKPHYDPHSDIRTPTVFTGTRTPIADRKRYRKRLFKDAWKDNGI